MRQLASEGRDRPGGRMCCGGAARGLQSTNGALAAHDIANAPSGGRSGAARRGRAGRSSEGALISGAADPGQAGGVEMTKIKQTHRRASAMPDLPPGRAFSKLMSQARRVACVEEASPKVAKALPRSGMSLALIPSGAARRGRSALDREVMP